MSVPPSPGRLMFSPRAEDAERAAPWPFRRYVLLRLVGVALIVFLILTLLFVAFEVIPVDPTRVIFPRGCVSSRCPWRGELIQQWGLDRPLLDRYGLFLANILTGNLGISLAISPGTPAWDLIAPALMTTLAVFGAALGLGGLVGVGVGLLLARRRGSLIDAVVSFLFALPFAVPVFVLGFLALYTFVVWIPLVPFPSQTASSALEMILPGLVLIGSVAGPIAWLVRDYPLGPSPAAVRGPGDWRTVPPAESAARRFFARLLGSLPAVIAWTLGGVLAVEILWNIRGTGLLLWRAIIDTDGFVVLGIVVVLGLLVILPTLVVADILHEWLTRTWTRADGRSTRDFAVVPRAIRQDFRSVLDGATGFAGIVLLVLLAGMAIAAPGLVGPYPTPLTVSQPNLPPLSQHLLGTDQAGRDILTLLLYGGRPAFVVGLLGFAFALIAELAVVAAIGFFGPRAGVFVAIPVDAALALSIPFTAFLGLPLMGLPDLLIPPLVAWPMTTRMLHLETARLVPSKEGAGTGLRSRGTRALNLIWGAGPLIVGNALLAVALAVSIWATMGALGLTFAPGAPEGWGQMLNDAYYDLAMLRGQWWRFVPPSLCIFAAVLAPTLLGLATKRIPLPESSHRSPWAPPLPSPEPPVEVPHP